MTDYTELKRLAEDVNNNFPDKEDLLSMVCTPTVVLDLIADYDQLKAENERLAAACEKAEQIINAESKAAAVATGRGNLLQAENEALQSSRAKLAGELSRLRAKHKDWSVDTALSKGEQP
ncbi:hypothetical protein [Pseudomonas protegens]|uniref:hypothetical protein n=1 Tax=Pseudomonas protegens TaxID=380021 RepID=UPI001B3456A7|nr:hypothetical protein [Pseudomonas protegens]MBP5121003.1 hypothetical protein [Pseudomonas protegens]